MHFSKTPNIFVVRAPPGFSLFLSRWKKKHTKQKSKYPGTQKKSKHLTKQTFVRRYFFLRVSRLLHFTTKITFPILTSSLIESEQLTGNQKVEFFLPIFLQTRASGHQFRNFQKSWEFKAFWAVFAFFRLYPITPPHEIGWSYKKRKQNHSIFCLLRTVY